MREALLSFIVKSMLVLLISRAQAYFAQEKRSDVMQGSQQYSSINYHLYHKSDQLLKMAGELVSRHPDKMSIKYLTSSKQGYSAKIAVVTCATNHYRFKEQKLRVFLSFGQHGRELITSEVALRLLKFIAGEYHSDGFGETLSSDILQKVVLKVVPLENLNGRKLVEGGKHCERKNGRGVDVNRNWGVDWGKKEKDYDPSEEFPGTEPFSEPETRIMKKIAHSFRPHVWVNVHSGMEALFMPYDHKNYTPNSASAELMNLLLRKLNDLYCKNACVVGSGGGSVGYLAHGTATDYMYEVVRVPMAFTFEIYGDLNASKDDCFRMFNPTDSGAFEDVLENWSTALLYMFINIPNYLNLSATGIERLGANDINHQTHNLLPLSKNPRRNIWTNDQLMIMQNEINFLWGMEQGKKMSAILFACSVVLLLLVYYNMLKCKGFQKQIASTCLDSFQMPQARTSHVRI